MDKFSLYDLLGLLLPGIILVWLLNCMNTQYTLLPVSIPNDGETLSLGMLSCLGLIAGSMLYVVNFWRFEKQKFYRRLTGVYKHVAHIYLNLDALHPVFNDQLNKQAQQWYNCSIYYSQEEFKQFNPTHQQQLKDLQDQFYDRMYYELEYHGKIETAKTLQSFYYFFRQLATALLLTGVILLFIQPLFYLFSTAQLPVTWTIWIECLIGLILSLALCAVLARSFRNRMVMKMYWAYFTHLNETKNK